MKQRIEHHKDGSVRAKGHMLDDELHGYWEWFRKDGSRMRSGHFDKESRSANGPPMTARERS